MASLVFRATGLQKYIPQVESVTGYVVVVSACFIPALILILIHLSNLSSRTAEPRGCRKLGLRIQSNLADEHEPQYAKGVENLPEGERLIVRVKSLWIYPVKSTRGVELNRGDVIPTGFQYDRQFAFADLKSKFPMSAIDETPKEGIHTWKFLTQRQSPKMARIKTEMWVPDPSSPTYSAREPNVQSGGVVVMRYPWIRDGFWGRLDQLATRLGREPYHTVRIPFNPTPEQIQANGYTTNDMEIWRDKPESLCIGSTDSANPPAYLQELRYFLNVSNPLALFRIPADKPRQVFRNAPKKDQLGWQPVVGFADSYPLHILNLASVHNVAAELPQDAPKLSILQFRGNIIVTGPRAYAEDVWKRIRIGEYEYYVTSRTGRCKLPNVNQITGVAHGAEPDKTLRCFRCIDEGVPKVACLGMMLVPVERSAVVKVGDEVEVLETGEHYYLKL